MGYHAINKGSTLPIYRASACNAGDTKGTLANGEVFTRLNKSSGYKGVYEVNFLNSSGAYDSGFITGGKYGNLAYSGKSVSEASLGGSCYRFKLRKVLKVVSTGGALLKTLPVGSYVFTRGATAGQSNAANMHIIGYQESVVVPYEGFVTLDYKGGSSFARNFCIYNA